MDIYFTAILVLKNVELDGMKDMGLKVTLFGKETFLKFPLTLYFDTSRGSKLGNLHGSFLLRSKNIRELNTNLYSDMIKRVKKKPCRSHQVSDLCLHKMVFYSYKILRVNNLTQLKRLN